ncbi:hypothetical protein EJ04DRAFT_518325 [Polyplosphaeria fusca]|uniref:Uncharacterized protein n=1 Tax=Polyplosphaeria fusca TaxID=682080 RepID=A0A9P4VA14_9PLEO|nr:hypothetical protein EJ04DRAFT_518325 [Polyplosphaeria fusca]
MAANTCCMHTLHPYRKASIVESVSTPTPTPLQYYKQSTAHHCLQPFTSSSASSKANYNVSITPPYKAPNSHLTICHSMNSIKPTFVSPYEKVNHLACLSSTPNPRPPWQDPTWPNAPIRTHLAKLHPQNQAPARMTLLLCAAAVPPLPCSLGSVSGAQPPRTAVSPQALGADDEDAGLVRVIRDQEIGGLGFGWSCEVAIGACLRAPQCIPGAEERRAACVTRKEKVRGSRGDGH